MIVTHADGNKIYAAFAAGMLPMQYGQPRYRRLLELFCQELKLFNWGIGLETIAFFEQEERTSSLSILLIAENMGGHYDITARESVD